MNVKLTHRQVQVVFLGLMAGMLLAALDQTMTPGGALDGLGHSGGAGV